MTAFEKSCCKQSWALSKTEVATKCRSSDVGVLQNPDSPRFFFEWGGARAFPRYKMAQKISEDHMRPRLCENLRGGADGSELRGREESTPQGGENCRWSPVCTFFFLTRERTSHSAAVLPVSRAETNRWVGTIASGETVACSPSVVHHHRQFLSIEGSATELNLLAIQDDGNLDKILEKRRKSKADASQHLRHNNDDEEKFETTEIIQGTLINSSLQA